MIRDDFLLRQIDRLAQLLAARVRGEREPDAEAELSEAAGEARSLTAMTPDAAIRAPLPALIAVLGEPERLLRMGLIVAETGEDPERALALIDAAIARDPALRTEAVAMLAEVLG